MIPGTAPTSESPVIYPESDGLPMADNTLQFRWILVLVGNLFALFHRRQDVFVGGNLLWYPVEGHPEVRMAPDGLVVFGRPKGDRGSYKQWEENDVPLTVVFEVLSPGNSEQEMIDKLLFYEDYGVEEYYLYDPDGNRLHVHVRRGEQLLRQQFGKEFVSPRLGIRFVPGEPELKVYHPDGRPFLTFEELEADRRQSEQRAEQAQHQVEQVQQQLEQARQRADAAEERAEQARQRAGRLAQLSRAARLGQASAEDLAELERLEREDLS